MVDDGDGSVSENVDDYDDGGDDTFRLSMMQISMKKMMSMLMVVMRMAWLRRKFDVILLGVSNQGLHGGMLYSFALCLLSSQQFCIRTVSIAMGRFSTFGWAIVK